MSQTNRDWSRNQANMFSHPSQDRLSEDDLVYFILDPVATLDRYPSSPSTSVNCEASRCSVPVSSELRSGSRARPLILVGDHHSALLESA